MSHELPYIEEGNIVLNGAITLTLRECITGEKLWLKRIEVEPIWKPYRLVVRYKALSRVEEKPGVMGVPIIPSKAIEENDDTDKVLASAISEFYAALGDKLLRHIDPEEWSKYLDQAEKLRKEKRY